ncbi:MAG: dihydrolipoyl dehydrogenase [Spirochaetes bacterium]|nr:MAG: dihydrolipoyl dehydrogenase [Spirochaetota bacterium]
MEDYDVAIVGSGSAGYVAAIRAADLGKHVVLIEQREIGGTCLNRGCIPTKALLKSAEVYNLAKESAVFGINTGELTFNPALILERKQAVVKKLVDGVKYLLKARKVVIKNGKGKLADNNTVEVNNADGNELVRADSIVIATGSDSAAIPVFNIDRKNVITSDEALNLNKIPESMLIVGAGAIGIEFADYFASFGVKVTVVEMMPQVVPSLKDKKMAQLVERIMKRKGIKIKTGAKIENVEIRNDGYVVSSLSTGEEIETEKVLVSIGRKLNSDSIGLEKLGVNTEKGKIVVDNKLRTNIPNIYAIGDVIGGLLLAHKAQREGDVVAEIIAGRDINMDYTVVPWAIFSSPEIASVGLTADECEEKGIETIIGSFPFSANGKAVSMNSVLGQVKLVARKDTGGIVGAQIVGPEASVMIAELALAVRKGLTLHDVADTIHTHPTLPEAVMEAAKDGLGEVVHIYKK